jgi:hypothetical protein
VELTLFAATFSRIDTIRISAPDLLLLISAALKFVSMLAHIVIDEDLTWTDFTLSGGPSLVFYGNFFSLNGADCLSLQSSNLLAKLATALDRSFIYLQTLLLVCSHQRTGRAHRRLLHCRDAVCFSKVMSAHCLAPSLRTFHFYADDGFVAVTNWGRVEEEMEFIDDWDHLHRPAVVLDEAGYEHLF